MDKNFESKGMLVKWLRILFYIHIAGIVVSAVSYLPIYDGWVIWVNRAIAVGAIVCLFQITSASVRYRKAAIFKVVMFVCNLTGTFGIATTIFVFAGSICSLISVYQEYNGHSEIVSGVDEKLSGRWHSLFNWQIIVGILSGFASAAAIILVVMLQIDTDTATTVIVGLSGGVGILLEVIYVNYLNRMCGLLQDAD